MYTFEEAKQNHYAYISLYADDFSKAIGLSYSLGELSVAHGDKCRGYKDVWKEAGIPFGKGALLYLLSYVYPYSQTVRNTESGWVDVDSWVIKLAKDDELIKSELAKLPDYF